MNVYRVKIKDEALQDIQEVTDWYNFKVQGLGSRFQKNVKTLINSLKTNPERFSIRYALVRCSLVKNFPFLVHYTIDTDKQLVIIIAIYHTSRNPKIWKVRS